MKTSNGTTTMPERTEAKKTMSHSIEFCPKIIILSFLFIFCFLKKILVLFIFSINSLPVIVVVL